MDCNNSSAIRVSSTFGLNDQIKSTKILKNRLNGVSKNTNAHLEFSCNFNILPWLQCRCLIARAVELGEISIERFCSTWRSVDCGPGDLSLSLRTRL